MASRQRDGVMVRQGLGACAAESIATGRGRGVVLTMDGVLSWRRANALGASPTGRIPHAPRVLFKGTKNGEGPNRTRGDGGLDTSGHA